MKMKMMRGHRETRWRRRRDL